MITDTPSFPPTVSALNFILCTPTLTVDLCNDVGGQAGRLGCGGGQDANDR